MLRSQALTLHSPPPCPQLYRTDVAIEDQQSHLTNYAQVSACGIVEKEKGVPSSVV